ncbi:MAG: chemotaxis protein CheW [Brevinemataceae bacterium]
MTILPFCLQDVWFGMDLQFVKGVHAAGKITVVPNSRLPLAGLMQKNGKILPVWSLFHLVNGSINDLKHCSYYIELFKDEKTVALPVEKVLSVLTVSSGWIEVPMFGLTIYRCLAKKPHVESDDIVEKTETFSDEEFNIKNNDFSIEEISE